MANIKIPEGWHRLGKRTKVRQGDKFYSFGDWYASVNWHTKFKGKQAAETVYIRKGKKRKQRKPVKKAPREARQGTYALRLFIDDKRVMSNQIDKEQAGIFMRASQHLTKYLKENFKL